ncbi:hypothetical protein HYFRA_00009508 [Hymenoscyphus fraxineus]|uniref:3-dehydrosphinganine reductase n=1 Tax=Hymenoscyphus fraxineus TaxID=746836 RepID=A0A9N9KXZ6_9HELO|nr:hypothetical protein HYFRA_00009508 [Hymenoscyphus fraxineus]
MDLQGKVVFIAGGSTGLGREIAKKVASEGSHVTIFARRQEVLEKAWQEISAVKQNTSQRIAAVPLDMSDYSQVETIMKSQKTLPDILYCVAGGTPTQCGFLIDITAADIESCMKNNYYTSAYMAHWMLRAWIEDDKTAERETPRLRQIVFINSAAAFLGLPGYTAYTPSKCAVRALADTLRMEALRYSSQVSTYTIHCAFPSNFITESFFEEQKRKPKITKEIEGTLGTVLELRKKFPSAEKVAQQIIKGVSRGEFALCDDSLEGAMFFANMVGPSPKRGLGIVDSIFAILVGFFVWPNLRRIWERKLKRESGFV